MDLLRSLPIGLYLEQPQTWLHKLDPRVKFTWLMTFLIAPLLSNLTWRLGLVVLLIVITLSALIPMRVWRKQMVMLLIFSFLLFALTAIFPDGLAIAHHPQLPAVDLNLPQPQDYQYVVHKLGKFEITRRSLDLGVKISTLFFTLLYSTNLYLLTTAPEEITAGLEELCAPLQRFNIPITEIMLTLTLSLRFIPLVLEEIQNLARSVRTRAINWKKLGLKRGLQIWLMVSETLLENLLRRAEQIAIAMDIRGFTSPNTHRVQWHQLQLHRGDWLVLISLIPFWYARLVWG